MDMIYANENMVELGVLKEYTLDLAYGKDENDFEITMPLRNAVLKEGYYVYNREDANIGGIIHKVTINSKANEIKYEGITWHGILAEKIIIPPKGQAYETFSGDANIAIDKMLTVLGLEDPTNQIFTVTNICADIVIDNYQVRYGDAYSVLLDMLSKAGAKLNMRIYQDKILLEAVPVVNYATDEEWSSSQRNFVAERDYLPINHMVCLGSGELEERHVIHLFSDGTNILRYIKKTAIYDTSTGERLYDVEARSIGVFKSPDSFPAASLAYNNKIATLYNGRVYMCESINGTYMWVNYSVLYTAKPDYNVTKDSDYILNEDMKYYKGVLDRAVVYDYSSAQTINNYKKLTSKPRDWETNFKDYYKPTRNYTLYRANTQDVVEDVKPICVCRYIDEFPAASFSVWDEIAILYDDDSNATVYKVMWNSGTYYWGDDSSEYTAVVDKETKYNSVEAVKYEDYVLMTTQPADWDTNPEKYYWADFSMGQIVGYLPVEQITVDKYEEVTNSQFWESAYLDTYHIVDNVYVPTESVTRTGYDEFSPNDITDWNTNWGDYYTRIWDGVSYIYEQIPTHTAYFYVEQESQPGDWGNNWKKYYERTNDGYVTVKSAKKKNKKTGKVEEVAPTWYAHRYYNQLTKDVAPPKSDYNVLLYKPYSQQVAPPFEEGMYYRKKTGPESPPWASDMYYEHVEVKAAPAFGNGYYQLFLDHYADLVNNGIKKFTEYLNCDKIEVSLNPSEIYDIGDIVGAKDEITGLSIWQPVTKKIIKIQKDKKTVDYKIGG